MNGSFLDGKSGSGLLPLASRQALVKPALILSVTSDTANALLVMRAPSVTASPFLNEVRHDIE